MGILAFLILLGGLLWLGRRVAVLEREVRRLQVAPDAITSPAPGSSPVALDPSASRDVALSPGPPSDAPVLGMPSAAAPEILGWRPSFDFEDLFGRLLPIWAGGVTLAVAGFFLVRWSIEAGLLTPPVRVVLAGLFGIGLLAGAEGAYRWRERVADPRVAQALAGAGLATLYAAFYLAGSTYGLIAPAFAFVGLAAVTATAIALSFRFGLPSAVLGLVGGFAAPALVGAREPNLPLLTLYLALVTGGLTLTGRRQARPWMGAAALAGGLGWGALLTFGDAARAPDVAALGAYLVVLGGVLAAFTGGEGALYRWVRVGAAGIAALQLAVLVAQAGFGPLEWGLYLILGAALAWFGWRDSGMREGGAVAAAVGVLLLAFWTSPSPPLFAAVAAGLAVVFAGVPLLALWRGRGSRVDIGQVAGVAVGLAGAIYAHFAAALPEGPQVLHGLVFAAIAALPGLAAHLAGRPGNPPRVGWIWGAQAAATLIAYGALAQVLPQDALGWTAAGLALAAAWRGATLAGALATAAFLAASWAIVPTAEWIKAGAAAVAGTPAALADLPSLHSVLLFAAPAAAALAAWRVLAPPAGLLQRLLEVLVLAGATVVLHTVFRHGFAAIAGTDFVATGVTQRAAWEALLVALGWTALSKGWRLAAGALAALALAHFAWFAAGLHNPVWDDQAVGALPLANALLPMYAAGFGALWLAYRSLPRSLAWPRWMVESATMAAIALFAMSLLRQVFAGTLPSMGSVTQAEDLLRSLLGILLAMGFLLWGARTGRRSWRIGSLVVMVVAVLKVFLVDAAGLEGLARIASFMALGFSLIGIGWFYNRQLRPPETSSAR